MNALSSLFRRDQVEPVRTSAWYREALAALPQPQRYSEMLYDAAERRKGLASLTGQALEDAAVVVAGLDADAAAYRKKHDRVFVQSAELLAELAEVQRRERQAIIADRVRFHDGPETEDFARLAAAAMAARNELLAQKLATYKLSKAWGMEIPFTLGFPTLAVEKRAAEILAELQSAS